MNSDFEIALGVLTKFKFRGREWNTSNIHPYAEGHDPARIMLPETMDAKTAIRCAEAIIHGIGIARDAINSTLKKLKIENPVRTANNR